MTLKTIAMIGDSIINIEDWAAQRKLIDPAHSSASAQFLKLASEMGELADNLAKGKDVRDDIGDCFVVLTIIARLAGTSIAECAAIAYEDIKDRKGIMYQGVFIKESDPRYAELTHLQSLGYDIVEDRPATAPIVDEAYMADLTNKGKELGKL